MEKSFDTSGYSKDESRPLPIGKNKEVMIDLMKDELGGKIMTEFVALRTKMYAYRKIDKKVEEKRCKSTKSVWLLKTLRLMTIRPACLMVKQYTWSKCCLRIRNTVKVNMQKIVLNRDGDKRLVQADGITTLAR